MEINGSTTERYAPVKQLFAANMATMAEDHAQLCVYHRGEKVVDLWASKSTDQAFDADSLVNVFSSGKSLEAIALASLVGKGLLDYNAKIVDYWPEFGVQDKSELTVAQLMRHEAGLASFDTSLTTQSLLRQSIKENQTGEIIEQQPLNYGDYEAGSREYHAMTRGWIANELFRRIDPAGRTIGEYLHTEMNAPDHTDVVIGVQEEVASRVIPIKPLGFGYQLLQSLIPRRLGRKIVHNIRQIVGRLIRLIPSMRKGSARGAPPPVEGFKSITFFNKPEFASGETPSANAHCSARGLARLASAMSQGGTYQDREYLNEAGWQALHDKPVTAKMGSLLTTSFTQGGVALFNECDETSTTIEREFNEGREGFYGWMGLGGSIFQWHPDEQIGFAFVPTTLHVLDFLNERGKVLQAEVLRCARDQN